MRVAAAGVCHSDVHLVDGLLGHGRWPMVLGHEGAGVVDGGRRGRDRRVAPGDHVAFCFVPSCGACQALPVGQRRTLCETAGRNGVAGMLMDGTSRLPALDGSVLQHGLMVACFAEYAVVPAAGAVPLPPSIPLWQAALLGCGVVTGIGAVNRARLRVGDSVCVIGCGGVGLQVIAGARLAGAGSDHRRRSRRGKARAGACARRDPRRRRDRHRRRRGGPDAHRRRGRARLRGRGKPRDDPSGVGRAEARAAPRSWSGWPRRESRCRCPRSSSSQRRRSPAATTARPTSTLRSAGSCSWSSTGGSTWGTWSST